MSFQNCKIKEVGSDAALYHADSPVKRGQPDFVMSSSALREFQRNAQRWIKGYVSPESESKRLGSLLDCLLLTPKQFDRRYAVQPADYTSEKGEVKPWNNNANVCRQWVESQAGSEIAKQSDIFDCQAAIARMDDDPIIKSWLDCCDTQAWLTGEWKDDKTGLIVPMKALVDFVPRKDTEFAKCLGDLKRVKSGALTPFQRQCYQYGWHIQAALYQDMYVAATGEDRNTWCFVVQENYEPWEPARRLLSQDFVQIGRQTYQHALGQYARCLKSGDWPGYDDNNDAVQGWSICAAEPWMEFSAISDAMESDQAEANEPENFDVPMP